jgi:hypothetical protein
VKFVDRLSIAFDGLADFCCWYNEATANGAVCNFVQEVAVLSKRPTDQRVGVWEIGAVLGSEILEDNILGVQPYLAVNPLDAWVFG